MPAIFCLRLACGLLASLLLLSPAQVNPRFYRTQFLTALGLAGGATMFLWSAADAWLRGVLILLLLLSFAGSVLWHLEGAPGGRGVIVLTALAAALALGLAQAAGREGSAQPQRAGLAWLLLDDLSSAALLGTATTAMLMGHSYLVAPAMSLTPLLRLLAALAGATLVRTAVAAFGLWSWTAGHSLTNLADATVLWLPVRWGLGLVGPLALGWMAWQSARIRSTQSATGILYVVVIFCFLGELTSQLIWNSTRCVL